ncbi:BLUF domain-containing protein [Erythrobacter sp. F6033]|uniref:BLUF domain-containing protein n=1 Tax=Erythrobacter sp. F6033 TaxID=2926401 RepID=UPI001FF2B450|nr:BLUF domain-containing protein [Erythrobacter sp. F6033]MCK0129748.1 BLUF domain-containing protein [Erythrobacter sp. F6033]
MLSQYLYISTAPSLSREEVDSILASSARNNPARGVTGLLLYNGRNFLQLLEGGEAELVDLMVRITHDPRHTGVSMLEHRKVEQRACSDWAMKRIMISESVENRREALDTDLPENLDTQIRKIIMNFAVLN